MQRLPIDIGIIHFNQTVNRLNLADASDKHFTASCDNID